MQEIIRFFFFFFPLRFAAWVRYEADVAQQEALHPRVVAMWHAHTPSPHDIRRQPYDGKRIGRH